MGKFDEFFDDVVVNAKTAASAVSKKASNVYDTSKHRISAAGIRGEINQKLRELGKYSFKQEAYGTDMSEEIARTVAEIRELKENLDIINAHIDSVKNQKKCPNCAAKVPKNSVFCNICGARIDEEVEPTVEAEPEAEQAPAEKPEPAVKTTAEDAD